MKLRVKPGTKGAGNLRVCIGAAILSLLRLQTDGICGFDLFFRSEGQGGAFQFLQESFIACRVKVRVILPPSSVEGQLYFHRAANSAPHTPAHFQTLFWLPPLVIYRWSLSGKRLLRLLGYGWTGRSRNPGFCAQLIAVIQHFVISCKFQVRDNALLQEVL